MKSYNKIIKNLDEDILRFDETIKKLKDINFLFSSNKKIKIY